MKLKETICLMIALLLIWGNGLAYGNKESNSPYQMIIKGEVVLEKIPVPNDQYQKIKVWIILLDRKQPNPALASGYCNREGKYSIQLESFPGKVFIEADVIDGGAGFILPQKWITTRSKPRRLEPGENEIEKLYISLTSDWKEWGNTEMWQGWEELEKKIRENLKVSN